MHGHSVWMLFSGDCPSWYAFVQMSGGKTESMTMHMHIRHVHDAWSISSHHMYAALIEVAGHSMRDAYIGLTGEEQSLEVSCLSAAVVGIA